MSKESTGQESIAKSRWVAEIDANLQKGDFAKAKSLIQRALSAFPDDEELYALEEKAIQGREQCALAFQMMEEGHQLCTDLNFEEGIEVLRNAFSLDNHNSVIRTVLIDNLLTHARTNLERDLAKAEYLAQEVVNIDPANTIAKGLARSIEERKRLPKPPDPAPTVNAPQPDAQGPESAPKQIPTGSKQTGSPDREVLNSVIQSEAQDATLHSTGGHRQPLPASPAPRPNPVIQPVQIMVVQPTSPQSPAVNRTFDTKSDGKSGVTEPDASKRIEIPQEPQIRHAPRASLELPPQKAPAPPTPSPSDVDEVQQRLPRPNWIWIAACLALLVMGGIFSRRALHRAPPIVEPIPVEIRTAPPGAKIRINGDLYDIARQVSLSPGTYQVEAQLDGYTTAVKNIRIAEGFKGPVDMVLSPVIPGLRVVTDLEAGTLQFDDRLPVSLQDGLWSLDQLPVGNHILKIKGGSDAQAVVHFQTSDIDIPSLLGPVDAKDLRVIFIGSRQTRGQIYSTTSPAQVTIDGRPSGQVPKSGALQLVGLTTQSHELLVGADDNQQKIQLEVTPNSGVYISAISDRNIGTLEFTTNEDNFQLLVNGRPHSFLRQKGRFVLRNLEAKPTTIQLVKAGYQIEPAEQKIVVKKGESTSVNFRMTPIPTIASLHLAGAAVGTHVVVDGKSYDVAADGSLNTAVNPGDRAIELQRPGFKPKTIRVSFKAGQTVNLNGNDVMIDNPLTGKIIISSKVPPSAKMMLRRKDGSELVVGEHETDVPEGDYTLIASAAGYKEFSKTVKVSENAPSTLDIKLTKIAQAVGMEGWDDPGSWEYQDGWHVHKGGNFVLFTPSSSSGTLQFVARRSGGRQLPFLRGGKLQWVINFVNGKNYELFQLDKDKIYWRQFVDGKPGRELHADHGISIIDDNYELLIEFRNGVITQKIRNGAGWKALPQLADEPKAVPDSRFGFYLPGKDEVRISKFEFKPAE